MTQMSFLAKVDGRTLVDLTTESEKIAAAVLRAAADDLDPPKRNPTAPGYRGSDRSLVVGDHVPNPNLREQG